MSDDLRSFSELVAGLPDNTSALITPENVRELLYGLVSDLGAVDDDTDFTLSLPSAGTFVPINSSSPSPSLTVGLAWDIDVNSALVPDWAPLGINVPAGLIRGIIVDGSVLGRRAAGGQPDDYQLRIVQGASTVLDTSIPFAADNSQDYFMAVAAVAAYDVSAGEPLRLELANLDGSTDFEVSAWRLSVQGVLI